MSMKLSFQQIAQALGLSHWRGAQQGMVRSVCTDTRSLKTDELFVALIGDRFDAHNYLSQALDTGATALIVSRCDDLDHLLQAHPTAAAFVVDDTLSALGDLAHFWRMKQAPKVLAVTGSNGKTTTKELLAAILAEKTPVHKTEGNLNNLIGGPLTLLSLRDEPTVVMEMGMNALGEIARLAKIGAPDIGLITNVHPAHLEFLGSIDAIRRAKGELFDALGPEAVAIVNLDNPHTRMLGEQCRARTLTFSLQDPTADVQAEDIRPSSEGFQATVRLGQDRVDVTLPLLGRHNISNLLCAMAGAWAAGVEPSCMPAGIAKVEIPGRRLKLVTTYKGYTILDDCYNANPSSTKAALQLLKELGPNKRKIALLGDMLELGVQSEQLHREIGAAAVENQVNILLAFGRFSQYTVAGAQEAGLSAEQAQAYENWDDYQAAIERILLPEDLILIKGSRGSRMERSFAAIENRVGRNE